MNGVRYGPSFNERIRAAKSRDELEGISIDIASWEDVSPATRRKWIRTLDARLLALEEGSHAGGQAVRP
jgi:hypothetical protein